MLEPRHLQHRFDLTSCVLMKYDDRNNFHSIVLWTDEASVSNYQWANPRNSLRDLKEVKSEEEDWHFSADVNDSPNNNLSPDGLDLHNIFIIHLSFCACSGTIALMTINAFSRVVLHSLPIMIRQGMIHFDDVMHKCLPQGKGQPKPSLVDVTRRVYFPLSQHTFQRVLPSSRASAISKTKPCTREKQIRRRSSMEPLQSTFLRVI